MVQLLFFFNFFYKINSFFFLLIILFIILILILSNLRIYSFNFKHLKNILFFSFISFTIIFTIEPGYDFGLYQIPFQKIIREEKIVFGISNFHHVFGKTGFYNYLAAPLWMENNFVNLANLQIIFYIIFFLYLYEFSEKDYLLNKLIILSMISLPFWLKFAPIKWGLVDFPFGVMFYLSFITTFFIFRETKKDLLSHNFSILIILNSLTFFLKPGGFIIFLLFSFLVFFLLIKKIFDFKYLIKTYYFFILILVLWLIRNFINTSCLSYPFDFTCFDTEWGSKSDAFSNLKITKDWSLIVFQLIQNNIKFNFINIALVFLIISFIIFFHIKINKIKNNIDLKYFHIILLAFFLIELLMNNNENIYSRNTIKFDLILFEGVYFVITIFLLYFFIIIFFNFKKIKIIFYNHNLILLTFSISVLFLWIFTLPIPRLGFSFIGSFLFCVLLFFDYDHPKPLKIEKNLLLFKILFLLYTINFSFILQEKYFNLNSSNFNLPNINVTPRSDFGVKPLLGDRCWDILWCSPINGNIEYSKKLSYIFLKKKYLIDN